MGRLSGGRGYLRDGGDGKRIKVYQRGEYRGMGGRAWMDGGWRNGNSCMGMGDEPRFAARGAGVNDRRVDPKEK